MGLAFNNKDLSLQNYELIHANRNKKNEKTYIIWMLDSLDI